MTAEPPREATFLFLPCPQHRGRRRRQGLKSVYRPGEPCEDCIALTADDEPAAEAVDMDVTPRPAEVTGPPGKRFVPPI